ncbi:hypothetical protein [Paremcibacter congregatus]|nr:hypothetical protein [Paremcibacter congregatus]
MTRIFWITYAALIIAVLIFVSGCSTKFNECPEIPQYHGCFYKDYPEYLP